MKLYPLIAVWTMMVAVLVACGDDSSSNAKEEPQQSSSSSSSSSSSLKKISSSETEPESSSSVELSMIINEDSTIVDPRDSMTYKVLKIGDQIWMAENMKYSPEDAPCKKGVGDECLYTWSEAMGVDSIYDRKWLAIKDTTGFQGLCPPGWHVPSTKEAEAMVIGLRQLTSLEFDNEHFCASVVQEDMLNDDGSRDTFCERYHVDGVSNGFNMHLSGFMSGFWLIEEDLSPFSCTTANAVTFWGYSIWVESTMNVKKNNPYNLRCVMNADKGDEE